MQVELEMKFRRPLDWQSATLAIRSIVGENAVTASAALAGSSLAMEPAVLNSALAAERILDVATIVYFREGSDSIRTVIMIRSLAEAKRQCTRVARQIPQRVGTLSAAMATIQVQEGGTYAALTTGEHRSLRARIGDAIAENWMPKVLPSAATFALALYYLSDADGMVSAAIGLGSAAVGALAEGAASARKATDWKWKELV